MTENTVNRNWAITTAIYRAYDIGEDIAVYRGENRNDWIVIVAFAVPPKSATKVAVASRNADCTVTVTFFEKEPAQ